MIAEHPKVAGLWIGGALSWLEQLCLKSFVEMGHPTALYTYEEVTGVPDGVEILSGQDILPDPDVYKHERSGSVALFSDIFRFHMIAKAPGTIWIDTDIYCWKPMVLDGDHYFGWESNRQMNGAVLGLPGDSEMLRLMLDFTSDPYNIPDFYGEKVAANYRARAEAGDPVHAGEMPWGVWGPHCVSWAARKSGEVKFAQDRTVFYPVPFPDRNIFFRRLALAMRHADESTLTFHLWGRIKRMSGRRYEGSTPDRSFLKYLLDKHEIDPTAAPITSHGKFDFVAEDEALEDAAEE